MTKKKVELEDKFLLSIYPVIKALAHPVRLKILNHLKEGGASVIGIVEGTGINRQVVTFHLGLMKEAGVLTSMKEGIYAIYQIDGDVIESLSEDMMEFALP